MGKGLISNIQRYSIHDGGGIRTMIFFKGCPLNCPWCANPEARGTVQPIEWQKNGVKETVGRWQSAAELVQEVLKDEIFYRTSGGGVTLSGGEVLTQPEFVAELLRELQDIGIHTAIETTGCYPSERLESLLPYLDQVLFDLKMMDDAQSKRVIGVDIQTVKENFELALNFSDDVEVIPRIPLIPGFTTSKENLLAVIAYLQEQGVSEVHLLPFHQYGSGKYEYLGWDYQMKDTQLLLEDELAEIKSLFEEKGLTANVDGLE